MTHAGRLTSVDSPIKVFWVADAAHGTPGRLGLTFAPGKKAYGSDEGVYWDRDLRQDMERLREAHGADLLVSLLEDFEYEDLGIPDLFTVAEACGVRTEHFPIQDTRVPRAGQEGEVDRLIATVRSALAAGETVVIHCMGGHGRTGTVAALTLASYGLSAEEAIRCVRVAQPKALENELQTDYVAGAGRRWASAGTWAQR
ncbi:MAG: dual specificity protein phosphatase family protein [Trueperaceae bacterium]|nr:dual specificity protein phosphatase family protein [Trueperaceae bacterium]